MSRGTWWLVASLALGGCPTEKAVTFTVVPETHEVSVRLHDLRTSDGDPQDVLLAGALLATVDDGVSLVDGAVSYEEVDGGLDVVADLVFDDVALQRLVPASLGARFVCPDGPVLATNGALLSAALGVDCLGWAPDTPVLTWTLAGDATDDQESLLGAWRGLGAPATLVAEPLDL